jgi:IS5 family transposase
VTQEKRLRVVQRAQTAKQLKLEVQRLQLREEENYHFHRLTASHLAEAVHTLFTTQGRAAQAEVKEEPKEEEQRAVIKQNQDDIFVDGD